MADRGTGSVHTAYGLRIRSSLPLPELPAASEQGGVDVSIRHGRVTPPARAKSDEYARLSADTAYLHWADVGTFRVDRGREVVVRPRDSVDAGKLRYYLLGPVLAVLLHQRRLLVLHASAIATAAGAVLFVGDSGWGKSSVAAAFGRRGHRVLTDDVAPISSVGGQVTTFPGPPQLYLWPETADALDVPSRDLNPVCPGHEKQVLAAQGAYQPDPVPVHGIFELDRGPKTEVLGVGRSDACMILLRHSYLAPQLARDELNLQFRHCAELARRVSVRRIRVESTLSSLPRLAERLESEFRAERRAPEAASR